MTVLTTARLRLEPFVPSHLDGLCVLNSDPRVMRYITGRPQTREETMAAIQRVMNRWAQWGFSWWSFFERDSGDLVGAGCIQYLAGNPANPLEIGWRLRPDRWHRGLAGEAARRMTMFAFETIDAPLLTAVANPENTASRRVMERLGMRFRGTERWYDADVATYEMDAEAWLAQRSSVDIVER
jgi:ribosomal-protein-alanine N-acetyltransferase